MTTIFSSMLGYNETCCKVFETKFWKGVFERFSCSIHDLFTSVLYPTMNTFEGGGVKNFIFYINKIK